MDEREAAAGLTLAGNNTLYGRGERTPTIDEREVAAGLTLFGHSTTDREFQRQNRLEELEDYIYKGTSIIRQRASLDRRRAKRDLKEDYKQAINEATNTRDKRKLKRERDEKIQDALEKIQKAEDTANERLNKGGTGDSIHDDSIDKTGSAPDNSTSNPAGGADVPPVLKDYTETTVTICINGTPTTGTIFFKAS